MSTHLPFLTKKIQEANDELMARTLGCKIRERYPVSSSVDTLVAITEDPETQGDVFYTEQYPDGMQGEFEILGHDIQLQHVLRAIDVVRPLKQSWYVKYDGQFWDERSKEWGGKYDTEQPFTNQKEPFYIWLKGVLQVTE